MATSRVEEIRREIVLLNPQELTELVDWLDQSYADLFDRRIQNDLQAGHLDSLIESALDQQRHGRFRPL
jgi:hypothetical protein